MSQQRVSNIEYLTQECNSLEAECSCRDWFHISVKAEGKKHAYVTSTSVPVLTSYTESSTPIHHNLTSRSYFHLHPSPLIKSASLLPSPQLQRRPIISDLPDPQSSSSYRSTHLSLRQTIHLTNSQMSHQCPNGPEDQQSNSDEALSNLESTITTHPRPHELQSQLPCLKCAIAASCMLSISPMDICDTKDGQPCTHCRSDGVFCSLPIDPESQHIFARLLYRHTVTGELLRTPTGDLVRRKAKDNVDFWREACRWIAARHHS